MKLGPHGGWLNEARPTWRMPQCVAQNVAPVTAEGLRTGYPRHLCPPVMQQWGAPLVGMGVGLILTKEIRTVKPE